MKFNNFKQNFIILVVILLLSNMSFAQQDAQSKEAIEYLKSTIEYSNKLLARSNSQIVTGSDIIEAELFIYTGDQYNNALIFLNWFLKIDNKLIPFQSVNDLLASPEFIESVKKKKFILETEENGIEFQSFLCSIDNEKPLGFFQIEGTWYFIRKKFFDDISAYEIATDKKGNTISVKYHSKLKQKLPENLLGKRERNINDNNNKVSKKDSSFIHSYFLKNSAKYSFEVSNLKQSSLSDISSLSFYKCNLILSDSHNGTTITSKHQFMMLYDAGKYSKFKNGKQLVKSEPFIKGIQKKIKIKNKKDAEKFEKILDDLSPVSTFDIKHKTFYLKDGIWFFVRNESFSDLYGFMLKVDKKGTISYLDYGKFTDEDILRFRMKDTNFKVDYKFKLIKPIKESIKVKRGENVKIQIDFDADMVNAQGAWILTKLDDYKMGMKASTNMKSPFTTEIPSEALENQYHTVTCYLLKAGGTDTANPLAVVKFKIEVE